MKRVLQISGIIICLAIMVGAQLYLSSHENQTLDEGVHLSAGYSYLTTGDFRLNREHPPLAKMIAAIPLLFLQPHLPLQSDAWKKGDQWEFAREFFYRSSNNPDQLLFLGRLPMIFMTLLLGIIVARWGFEIAKWKGAYFSTIWFVASPLILAHGHLITTDIPLTLGITASLYFFTKWAERPTLPRLLLTSFSVAFASDVKFTGLFMVVIIPLFAFFVERFFKKKFPHITLQHVRQLTLYILFITLLVILASTRDITLRMRDDPFQGQPRIQQLIQFDVHAGAVKHAAIQTALVIAKNVPLPGYPYLDGLILFLGHDIAGHQTFFLGDVSNTGSIWFFPLAFIIKSPFAFIICITLLFFILVKRIFSVFRTSSFATKSSERIKYLISQASPNFLSLIVFPTLYLLFAMTSHVNIGVRHIAPMFPVLFVATSYLLVSVRPAFQKMFQMLCFLILCIGLIPVILNFPYPLAFFSEIAGGPQDGHNYLLDSNLDWGQNLKFLKTYLIKHRIPHVCMVYFGQGDLIHEGIDFRYVPKNSELEGIRDINCVVAISAESLFWEKSNYTWLLSYKPTATIGWGIYLFDLRKPNIEKSRDL